MNIAGRLIFALSNNRLERIWILAKYDFKNRYYGNYLGVFWALLNPIFNLLIYFVLFGYLLDSKTVDFAVYLFSGIIAWDFYKESASKGLTVLTSKSYLFESITINHLDIHLASVFASLFGFLFNLLALLVMAWLLGVSLTPSAFLFLPIVVLSLLALGLATSIILSVIRLFVRDIQHVWDMFSLMLFWFTPIIFEPQVYQSRIPKYLIINPIAGVVTNFRSALFSGMEIDAGILVLNLILGAASIVLGSILLFRYRHMVLEVK